jgi:glycosyltransferase involved in cell wall biosynthesis
MYNEEAGVAACVAAVCRTLDRLSTSTRLIVVNDGSVDGTGAALTKLQPAHPQLDVVTHSMNRGYGTALRSGVEAAAQRGDEVVLFMDSDLTNDPVDIPRLLAAMGPDVDVVKATRFSGDGGMRGVPLRRRVVSRAGNAVARAFFRIGISDCTNGFRALRTSVAMRFRLRETGFPIIVEELYCCVFAARGFAEVPVVLTSRPAKLRGTSFAYRPSVIWRYLKYATLAALRVSPGTRLAHDERERGPGAH